MNEHDWIIRKFATGMSGQDRSWVMDARPDVNGKVVAQVIAMPTTNPDWEKIAPLLCAVPKMLDALERIVTEASELAKDCPPAPHACPACEILYVAKEAIEAATGNQD